MCVVQTLEVKVFFFLKEKYILNFLLSKISDACGVPIFYFNRMWQKFRVNNILSQCEKLVE